jgi:hypothetical protein
VRKKPNCRNIHIEFSSRATMEGNALIPLFTFTLDVEKTNNVKKMMQI